MQNITKKKKIITIILDHGCIIVMKKGSLEYYNCVGSLISPPKYLNLYAHEELVLFVFLLQKY